MSIFELGHPDVSRSYWDVFRSKPWPLLFSEIIDRSNTGLPDYVVPLARGVAVANDLLQQRAGFRPGSSIPRRWRRLNSEFVSETWQGGMLYTRRYRDLWNVEWATQGMLPQTLVHRFGSTPVVTRTFAAALRLGEFCLSTPPRGLCWVSESGCDRGEHLIEFAKQRGINEALANQRARMEHQSNKAA